MNSDIKIQLCKDDFYLMMKEAVMASGGSDDSSKWKQMKLEEIVNLFATNGIRMVYMPEKHMNSIRITWGDEKAKTDGNPPKKKQLLCDQKDIDDDWNELHT